MNTSNITWGFDSCKYRKPDNELESTVKMIALGLVSAFGIFGNIFVIVLAAKYTVGRNLHHLIINMAVSDALFILMNILSIHWWSRGNWSFNFSGILGEILCRIHVLVSLISYNVSLITLLIISIERFRATRRKLHSSRLYTLKQRVAVLGVCWLIPIAIFGYILYSANVDEQGFCRDSTNSTYLTVYLIIMGNNVLAIISFCVIFLISILTIRRLSRPQAIQAHLNEEQRNIRARRTQAAVRMVLASLILYICCWLPYFIFSTVDISYLMSHLMSERLQSVCIDWPSLYFIVVYVFPVVNSCFSPLIYIIFLSDFREAAKKVLCRRTTNRSVNRRNSIELQPIQNRVIEPDRRGRRRGNSDFEEQDINLD